MLNVRACFNRFSVLPRRNIRNLSSLTNRKYTEVTIPVPWGYICGKWWGPTDKRPVLSLHGWQDNCGTFNRLIPLLTPDVGFLAIDLPGHGYSSRLPPGMYYLFTNYLILVRYLQKYFKWPKVSLMGHSMGGIASYCYTMLYPDEVDFMIGIDGSKPMIIPRKNKYIADNIDNFFRYNDMAMSTEEPPSFSLDEIKKKICAPNNNSIKYEFAHHIAERNVAPSKKHFGKYYFARDPRLKVGGLTSFSQKELIEYAQGMTCPMFILKAKSASYFEVKENFYEVMDILKRSSRDFDFHSIEGTHHVHLNSPEIVAPLINHFIHKNNNEDRTEGGLTEDLVSEPKTLNLEEQSS